MLGRSRIVAIGSVVGAVLLAGACSGDPKAEPTPTPTPTGPTVLSFAVYGPSPVVTAYTKIAADFNAEHPDIVVNVRPYGDRAEAMEALDKQLEKGEPSDAFLASLQDLPRLIDAEAVERLDELLGERQVDFGDGFQRDALEAFSSDNALQCMPSDVSPLVVYVNTDLIDLAAPLEPGGNPITADTGWKLEAFQAIAARASVGNVRGLYVAPTLSQVAPFVWSGGGELVDDNDDPSSLSLAESSAALADLLAVVRDTEINFTASQIATKPALTRFKAGQLAMMFGYRSLTPVLRDQQGLNFDVMPLPRVRGKATSGDSSGLCLSQASKHKEEAADFLAYAVSEPAMTRLAETGYVVPTNLDVVNADAFLQPTRQPASAQVFASGVRNVRSFPLVPTWNSVAANSVKLLRGLFYDPVIDPFDERLKAIDAASAPLFTPVPSPSPTVTSSPTPTPTPTS